MSFKNSELPNTLPFESERYVNMANNLTVDEIKKQLELNMRVAQDNLKVDEIHAYDLSMIIYFGRMLCDKLNIDCNEYINSYLVKTND